MRLVQVLKSGVLILNIYHHIRMNLINRLFKISFIGFFLIFSFLTQAQDGIPLIKKYSVEDYRAGIENWDAIEDNFGLVYFANSEGVLEYDGVHWRLIRTKSGNAVRSLTKDESGTIYVGGDYDFGYLQANAVGQKEYVSLVDKCPIEIQSHLKHVWNVFLFQGKKYFLADGWIVILDKKNDFIKVLKEDIYLRSVFVVDDVVYAYSNSKGILSLDPIKNEFHVFFTKPSLQNRSIELIAAHPEGGIRYHLFDEGFYQLKEGIVHLEKKTITSKIDTDYIFCQANLEAELVVGTTVGGLYVVEKESLFAKYHFDKQLGLSDNKVFAVYEDQYKNLWVCHENGLSYIAFNTPIRFFNERINIKGEGLCFENFNGYVFVGTTHGLFSCKQMPHEGFFNFELVEALRQPIFFLEKKQSTLLIGTLHGLFEYDGKTLKQLSESKFNKNIQPYPFGKDYFLTSTSVGFQLLQFNNGFKLQHTIVGANEEVVDFEIDLLGNVWLINSENKLFRGSLNKTFDTLNVFKSVKGIDDKDLKYLSLTRFNDDIIIGTGKGLYRYDAKLNTLNKIASEKFKTLNDANITLIFNQNNSNLWLQGSNFRQGKLDYNIEVLSDGFDIKNTAKNLNSSIYGNNVFSFDNYTDSSLAIGVSEGFLLYDLSFNQDKLSKARTYIRSVFFKDENDTTLIEGVWEGSKNIYNSLLQGEVTTVEFNCAANYYYSAGRLLYSYKLEGVDNAWSEWTADSKINYTIQGHGIFVFNVRTTNDYINITEVTQYRFTINKPWYQSNWWYATEIGALILCITLSVYFNRNGSSHISRVSAIIIVLTILTSFETMSELLQDWMDAQGETIFALKIAINISIALSISPIESWLKKKLIFKPIEEKE